MNKMYSLTLMSIVLGSSIHGVSRADLEKFEQAIASSKIDKVRSLLKGYESKNPAAQERKAFLEQLARIASDVVIDRQEKLSLQGNIFDILAYRDREKAEDLGLIGSGALLMALGSWYAKDVYDRYKDYDFVSRRHYSEYYQILTFNSGIATIGLSFGAYLAYRGYLCTMQANALKASEQIEIFIAQQAGVKPKTARAA